MATIMGLRSEREKLAQQKHQDLVNEMYQQAITKNLQEKTKLLPQELQLKMGQLSNQTRGALQKDLEFLHSIGYGPEQLQKYINSKMGDLGKYDEYVKGEEAAGREPKSYEKWDIARRRAGAMTIGHAAEKAGAIAEATAEARAEVKYLTGPDLRKDAVKVLTESNQLFMADDKEALIAAEMGKLLGQTFGPENVSPLLDVPGKGRGWKVRKKDGTTVWKGVSK